MVVWKLRKELEEENVRLKRMYADLAMDNEILRDLFTKKGWARHQKATNRGACEGAENTGGPGLQNSFITPFSVLLHICCLNYGVLTLPAF